MANCAFAVNGTEANSNIPKKYFKVLIIIVKIWVSSYYKYYIFFLQRYEESGERQNKSPCNAFCLPRNAYLCRRILNTINQNINWLRQIGPITVAKSILFIHMVTKHHHSKNHDPEKRSWCCKCGSENRHLVTWIRALQSINPNLVLFNQLKIEPVKQSRSVKYKVNVKLTHDKWKEKILPHKLLWFAFKLVSLQSHTHRYKTVTSSSSSCDLLSN